jgi:hypothetical protein
LVLVSKKEEALLLSNFLVEIIWKYMMELVKHNFGDSMTSEQDGKVTMRLVKHIDSKTSEVTDEFAYQINCIVSILKLRRFI